jgi:osmoprotectant transport system substrate-binding protein
VLGELWRQALAVNGFTVDLRKGVGPAADLDAQLRKGAVDGYVAYTGTVLSVVAGQEVSGLDARQTYDKAKAFYDGRGMAMSAMTPFQDKDAIAVTTAFAQTHRLRTVADLRKIRGLRLGARPEFEKLTLGLKGLEQTYGLSGVVFRPVPLGKQYAALDAGRVQAVDAFTTDPQLRDGDYRLLADPKNLFGSQNVVMTVDRDQLARVDGRRFLSVVSQVNQRLTQDDVVAMNAAVTDGQSDQAVARAFLRQAGLMDRRAY